MFLKAESSDELSILGIVYWRQSLKVGCLFFSRLWKEAAQSGGLFWKLVTVKRQKIKLRELKGIKISANEARYWVNLIENYSIPRWKINRNNS